jgi:hypothetical protein
MIHDDLDEDLRTETAAASAAKEREPNDDSPIALLGDYVVPTPGAPDIELYFSVTGAEYRYQLIDTGTHLSYRATGRLPSAAADPQSALLYSVYGALASVAERRIIDRLCERYGFLTRRGARESERKLIIRLHLPDAEILDIARAIAEAEDNVITAFLKLQDNCVAWHQLSRQMRRFDCQFALTVPDDTVLVRLDQWAKSVWQQAQHSGPFLSRAERVTGAAAYSVGGMA